MLVYVYVDIDNLISSMYEDILFKMFMELKMIGLLFIAN